MTNINTPVTSIDISNKPDLLRLAEEVKATRKPRLLKRNGETLAMLMPTGTAGKRTDQPQKRNIWTHYDPQRVKAALKHSAGALQGVDRKELLGDLAAQRSQESTGRFF